MSMIKTLNDLSNISFRFEVISRGDDDISEELKKLKQEFEKLKYDDSNVKKTLIVLCDFLISKEFSDIDKLENLNIKGNDHQEILESLGQILLSDGSIIADSPENFDFENQNFNDVLYQLGRFLLTGRERNISELNDVIYQKKLKLLGMFLISGSLKNVYLQKVLKIIDVSQDKKIDLLQTFFIAGGFTKKGNFKELSNENPDYKKRLNFLVDYILSANPSNPDESGKMNPEEDYKEMLNNFEKLISPYKLTSLGQKDVLDPEAYNHGTLKLLQELFLPGIFTSAEDFEKIKPKFDKHNEILFVLGDFLLFGLPKVPETEVEIEPEKNGLMESMQRDSNADDSHAETEEVKNKISSDSAQQEMRQKELSVKVEHGDVNKKNLTNIVISQEERLKLLGEFLKNARSIKEDDFEKFDNDDIDYQKRLRLIGDFLLSKNLTNIEEAGGINFRETFKDILKLFKDPKLLNTITREEQDSGLSNVHHESFRLLQKFLSSDALLETGTLETFSSECDKHLETLSLLGEFLLFGGPKGFEIRTTMADETMLADSPMPSRTTDVDDKQELKPIGIVKQETQLRTPQVLDISPNVQLHDNLVLLPINQEDKLELLGEFLIKERFVEVDDKLGSFIENDKGYKKKLKFFYLIISKKKVNIKVCVPKKITKQ
jgi:hypothetical protein